MIITINSGNNKLSCVVQKITIGHLGAIAIGTKGGNEATSPREVSRESEKGTPIGITGETSGGMTDETIEGMTEETTSGMKGEKKDATIDVTTIEVSELVDQGIEIQIVIKKAETNLDHQIEEISIMKEIKIIIKAVALSN